MEGSVFIEFSLIVLIAVLCAGFMRLLRQPLIIGYILAGILISPYGFNLVSSAAAMNTLAQIGIALLLFMVGLNLNPASIKNVGKVAILAGLGQVFFTFIICFVTAKLFGLSSLVSLYVAIALTFSSTIIVMKLLSDKGEVDSLYGRISVGFLIIQDLAAIVVLMVVSSLSIGNVTLSSFALETLLKGVLLFTFLFLVGAYLLPGTIKFVAKSQEFLLLFSIGWCLALATVFSYFNFSVEIGALLAGVTLSLSPYRFEISSKMKPLRDFFIILFFIMLGSQMVFVNISHYVPLIIVFSLLTLIGKPLIILILLCFFGYTRRTGFLTGITLAQISEFSFIIAALGVKVGHLSKEVLSFLAIIGLITIAGSTYFILYANKLYSFFSKYLKVFERQKKIDLNSYHKIKPYEIILFGFNRIGLNLLESFKKLKKDFLIIDYNPETILSLAKEGINCRYGDASDSELLKELHLSKAKMVVSTIPSFETNTLLIHEIRKRNKKTIIIVVSHDIDEAMSLYDAGASYVIMPHFLGGTHTSAMIEGFGLNLNKFLKEKVSHIEHLKKRKLLGHEHPKHFH
ncbi:sodium:proton exchanger [Candidatus Woesearchaeota archaeon]|nr:MAG: sodium:proton exchanger [Candidatus Woesearchaeota archaeon ex4484_78]RLE45421.1 MAG: sodium:proton exchanger [Candidatus Woesearchaeota archaeon]